MAVRWRRRDREATGLGVKRKRKLAFGDVVPIAADDNCAKVRCKAGLAKVTGHGMLDGVKLLHGEVEVMDVPNGEAAASWALVRGAKNSANDEFKFRKHGPF